MSVKPELAFDVCWEVYRGAREVLEAKRGMGAMDWKEATKYFRGGNMPRRNSSFPTRRRTSSDQFTQLCSLKPRKCRAFSYGAMPR